jgi:phospholipid/cholesterol/gamma-HCH transport system substrate-binding protein/paraquat-inducible protein B
MNSKTRYFKVGVFILSALTIIVIAILVLSGGTWFKEHVYWETYFDESVQGLEVGSPIKLRGVRVGTVEAIEFVSDVYGAKLSEEDLARYGHYVLVRGVGKPLAPHLTEEQREAEVVRSITKGLRVRLASQGLTGLVYLEADYLNPIEYPALAVHWEPRMGYVPSAPSTVMLVSAALVSLAKNLEKADVQKLVGDLDLLALDVAKFIKDARLSQLTSEASHTVAEFHETARQARRILEGPQLAAMVSDAATTMQEAKRFAGDLTQVSKQIRSAVEKLPEAATRLERSIGRVDSLLANKSQDIEETLENLRAVSENLRELTHSVKRYPAQVLWGSPPPQADLTRR